MKSRDKDAETTEKPVALPEGTFDESEIKAIDHIMHSFAHKMAIGLAMGQISEQAYVAYERLYEKLMYYVEGRSPTEPIH